MIKYGTAHEVQEVILSKFHRLPQPGRGIGITRHSDELVPAPYHACVVVDLAQHRVRRTRPWPYQQRIPETSCATNRPGVPLTLRGYRNSRLRYVRVLCLGSHRRRALVVPVADADFDVGALQLLLEGLEV